MTPEKLAQCTRRVADVAWRYQAQMLVNGYEILARKAGVCGVHSSGTQIARLTTRPRTCLWAVSCHNAVELAYGRTA